MSFLARVRPVTRASLTPVTRASTAARPAFFSSTPERQKGPVDATKETLKKADRLVSDAAVKGIETGGEFLSKTYLCLLPRKLMSVMAHRESYPEDKADPGS